MGYNAVNKQHYWCRFIYGIITATSVIHQATPVREPIYEELWMVESDKLRPSLKTETCIGRFKNLLTQRELKKLYFNTHQNNFEILTSKDKLLWQD